MVLLCDGGLAINVLSSILMNGVCCPHSVRRGGAQSPRQQAEELRRTINVEYERQRLFDKECRDRMRREEQLLAEKQRLVAEQLQQRRGGGGDMLLLCDEEHNDNNSNTSKVMSHAQIDTTRHATTMSAQSPSCPRRTLMAKKFQLSSPVSSAAASSPSDAASLSPRETWANRPVDGRQKLNILHNDAETFGRRRRYAYGTGWNGMMHHRGSARRGAPHQQRDDMSSLCASSTASLFDDSSDEEAY